jgi:sulfane dehydrogenase subunit SoxC
MTRSIPMFKALEDCLVAFKMNGEALRPEQGYPLRLWFPAGKATCGSSGCADLEVGDEPWAQREETSKYTDLLADGKARRHTWVMDVKSVITSPSPQAPICTPRGRRHHRPGLVGNGTIKRVDVSIDGGKNWQRSTH